MIIATWDKNNGLKSPTVIDRYRHFYYLKIFEKRKEELTTDIKLKVAVYFSSSEDAYTALYEWVDRWLCRDFDKLFYTKETLKEGLLYSEYYNRWMTVYEYADLTHVGEFPSVDCGKILEN